MADTTVEEAPDDGAPNPFCDWCRSSKTGICPYHRDIDAIEAARKESQNA